MTQQRLIVTTPDLVSPLVRPLFPFWTNGKRIVYLKNGPQVPGLPVVEVWSCSIDSPSPEKIFSEESSTSQEFYWFQYSLDNRAMQYGGFSFNYGLVDLVTKQVTRNGARNLGVFRTKNEAFATNAQGDLLLLDITTSQTTLLARNPTASGKALIQAEPAPNGSKIALTYKTDGGSNNTTEVWVLAMSGGNPVKIDEGFIDVDRWSEDGSTLLYSTTYPYRNNYVVRNGTTPRLLGRGKGYMPSPDGSYVAYQEPQPFGRTLHLLSLDSAGEIIIPNFDGNLYYWTR